MRELRSEFLMNFDATLNPAQNVGAGAMGLRSISDVTGGTFEGPRIKGTILPSGGDWVIVNPALGILNLDVRASLKTDDGAVIFAQYKGRIALAPEKFATLFDPSTGPLDPEDYYFRTAPTFETGSEKYAWINAIQAVGVGRITEGGVSYEIHEIK